LTCELVKNFLTRAYTGPAAILSYCRMARPIALLVIFFLAACSQQQPEPVVTTAPPPPAEAPETRWITIQQTLFEADQALARNRLTTPAHDNAYDHYREVLRIDPGNTDALAGMTRIAERYLQLAASAYQAGAQEQALAYVALARRVDPDNAALGAASRQYSQPVVTPDNEYLLSRGELDKKAEQLQPVLAEIAERARQLPSRLLIVARNDEEGRWIYRQMREAVEGHRLRGNIVIGASPKVVLLDVAP
jgi:tetratricopeptide (TPR) repeat protein